MVTLDAMWGGLESERLGTARPTLPTWRAERLRCGMWGAGADNIEVVRSGFVELYDLGRHSSAELGVIVLVGMESCPPALSPGDACSVTDAHHLARHHQHPSKHVCLDEFFSL
jgi:hypothetical protein